MRVITALARFAVGLAAVLLAACASAPRVTEPDGTYCFRIGKTNRVWRTCTTTPIPDQAAEADAKRFEALPGAVTLYIVRRRWADSSYQVPVDVDGRHRVVTIPASFVRVRLTPGTHTLSLKWKDQMDTVALSVRAGEVVFVDMEGAAWVGATTYRWQKDDETGARQRATRSTLIADLDLTRR